MKNQQILGRLFNDIISDIYSDAYIISQEDKINELNTHKVKGWRHCLDAYLVVSRNKSYSGSYQLDKKKEKPFDLKPLKFISYTNTSGIDFINFINSILAGNPKILVHIDNFIVYDLRKKMFEIKELEISNTLVDNFLLININKYFHQLEKLVFKNCTIKKECDFSKIKSSIEFDKSTIESIRVLNDTKADLIFRESKVEKIVPTNILSSSIEFTSTDQYLYKELFLKCNFPNLESLILYKHKKFVQSSYLDQFIFLPKSAPKLENIYIDGKLSSFDFLYDVKNLLICDIDSVYNYLSIFSPDVDTKKERDKLIKRNQYAYEVAKMTKDTEDKFIVGTLEIEKILRLAFTSRFLNYREDELKSLLEGKKKFITDSKDGEITKFYESYFDTLITRNTLNDKDIRLGLEETYFQLKDNIYMASTYKRLNNKKIVKGVKHIYRYDGTPIIFMNRKKDIRTKEDALDFLEKHNFNKSYNQSQMEKDSYQELLNIVSSIEEDVDIGAFIDYLGERTHLHIDKELFINYGEGGRLLAGTIETYYRREKRNTNLENKKNHMTTKLIDLINNNYSKFNTEEKLYLYWFINYYYNDYDFFEKNSKLYNLSNEFNPNILNDINEKTDNLFQKYSSLIKMVYLQSKIKEDNYYIQVKKEYIKKLEIKKM